ncbi:MAG: glycosyltransferase [Pseudomonadota bacterium]
MTGLTIIIPALNEAKALPALARNIGALHPPPQAVLVIDGGSEDETVSIAEGLGLTVVHQTPAGRAHQINRGVEAAETELVCVLHADTRLPLDAVRVITETLEDKSVALSGFTAVLAGEDTTRWGTTLHNWAKTWYAPLIFRPHLFFRGCRLLFGDHAMFFRKQDFLDVGGCDPEMMVMEDADMCVKFTAKGRVRLINRIVETSDRRVAAWGGLRANWIYFKVAMQWAFGARKRLGDQYPDIR